MNISIYYSIAGHCSNPSVKITSSTGNADQNTRTGICEIATQTVICDVCDKGKRRNMRLLRVQQIFEDFIWKKIRNKKAEVKT
jgi:hypothetical protein